ncbi:GNAT family N-acetyltransferase [Agrobacterium bohemicum]|uniref:Acetyltransferase n=1 Tax=Agrobacterium bohemicum TaxID=2052828 RepID=A0A135P4I1_9HYPH|nr:GNAT family N-acetyltransferase [Agrobacterium bohemicum]KXG86323.1 acetyltransferase [Agrobacterium bohemicum]
MNGFNGSFDISGGLTLRFCRPTDQDFLLELFMQARPWLAWAEGKKDFIRDLFEQQYSIMRNGQEAVYPEHLDLLIEKLGEKVGRVVLDLGYADWRISEIEVVSAARTTGIGSNVIRGLQAAARRGRRSLTLSTPIFGPSNNQPLYEKLGFRVASLAPPLIHMVWQPQE